MFDSLADKDAEIIQLKRNLHELESKYNGKFFNEPKIKHEYNMLLKENDKLRKELESRYSETSEKNRGELVNHDILEAIRYKKLYDEVVKEN